MNRLNAGDVVRRHDLTTIHQRPVRIPDAERLVHLQFRRYAGSQIVFFDRGRSARTATLGLGGTWYELGVAGGLAFQP